MHVAGEDLDIGDEVAAFDGATLVGAVVISSPGIIESLRVLNLPGQIMVEVQVGDVNTELNLSGFSPGVYFIDIVVDGQRKKTEYPMQ